MDRFAIVREAYGGYMTAIAGEDYSFILHVNSTVLNEQNAPAGLKAGSAGPREPLKLKPRP
jgi:hypothetical protein